MSYYLYLLILLSQKCYPICSIGCLKCSSNDECLYCDSLNQYYLQDGECELSTVQNCQIIKQNGNCEYCIDHYYFDMSKGECIEVPKELKIKNCSKYDSYFGCILCELGYYLIGITCRPSSGLIENCYMYQSFGKCLSCLPGYTLNLQQNSCDIISPAIDHCQIYSQLKCKICEDNYLFYENQDLINTFQDEINVILLNYEFFFLKNLLYKMVAKNQCAKKNVLNCKNYLSSNLCQQCNEGFYLTEQQQCQIYPINPIQNCLEYSSLDTCKQCIQGFYPLNGQCLGVVPIQNCLQYSTTANETQCILCQPNYYLKNTQCQQRVLSSISKNANCLKRNQTSDECLECVSHYYLSKNSLFCLKNIENCLYYMQTNDDFLECSQCQPQYLLHENRCIRGTLSNCIIYLSLNNCLVCKSGYYLKGSECYPIKKIYDCIQYKQMSSFTPDYCEKCQNNKYPIVIKSYCKNTRQVQNCFRYDYIDGEYQCSQCLNGYYIAQSKCHPFSDPFCAKGYNDICSHCMGGYVFIDDKCMKPFQLISELCVETNFSQINSLQLYEAKCIECQQFSYPILNDQYFYCIENSKLKYVQKIEIKNCEQYDENGLCYQCIDQYFLMTTNSYQQCLISCENNYAILKQNITYQNIDGYDRIQQKGNNICLKDDTGCLYKVPITFDIHNFQENNISLGSNKDDSICILCKEGYFNVIKSIHEQPSSCFNIDPSGLITDPMDRNTKLKCVSASYVNGNPNIQSIKNCQYYVQASNGQIYCTKCNHGYNGQVSRTSYGFSYIESCSIDLECKTNLKWYGLPAVYSNFLSCHKCVSQNQVPLMVLSTTFDYQIKSLVQLGSGRSKFKVYQCFQFEQMNEDGDLPLNCAFLIMNFSQFGSSSADSNNTSASPSDSLQLGNFCGGCLPGYKAHFLSDVHPHIVLKCTWIENCQPNDEFIEQQYFNKCSQCIKGYGFLYNSSISIVSYEICVKSISDNC